MLRRVVSLLLSRLALGQVAGQQPLPATLPAAPPLHEELLVAVYLFGLYFAQLDGCAVVGGERAARLSRALGRSAAARIYATAEALEANRGRVGVALVEAPYLAARLQRMTPLCVAVGPDGEGERATLTRLVVMGTAALPAPTALADHHLGARRAP